MSHSLTPLVHPMLEEGERQRCEVWTRVMGYHRPMASFNVGKKGEFAERRYFVAGRVEAGAGDGVERGVTAAAPVPAPAPAPTAVPVPATEPSGA